MTASRSDGASSTDREAPPGRAAASYPPSAITGSPPAVTNRTAERSDAAASTASSNDIVRIPVPRSSEGRRSPATSTAGPAESGTTISGNGANAARGLPDRSCRAPASVAARRAGPAVASASNAAARWAGVSRTATAAPPPESSDAPPRLTAGDPCAPTTDRRERLADDASMCSSNVTERMPLLRLSAGSDESSRRGAATSRATDRAADISPAGLLDRSDTAPGRSRTLCAPAAAAFRSGVSRTRSVSESGSSVRTGAAPIFTAGAGEGGRRLISDGSAEDADTYSPKLSESTPSLRSSRGGRAADRAGGDVSRVMDSGASPASAGLRARSATEPADMRRTDEPPATTASDAAFWAGVRARTTADALPETPLTAAPPSGTAGAPAGSEEAGATEMPDATTLKAATGSSNPTVSMPSPRSSRAPATLGGVASLLNETAWSSARSILFPDTSLNAPYAMSTLTGPFVWLAATIDETRACDSLISSVAPPRAPTEAPVRTVGLLPSESVTFTSPGSADAATTCSLNVKEIAPATGLSSMGC